MKELTKQIILIIWMLAVLMFYVILFIAPKL